jgi:tetratricopeptide (TPR) repeat protein
MLEGRQGALLAKALLHMQQGQLPEAVAMLKLVAALPDARFAGWANYFFGLLLKDCRQRLSASDVAAAMNSFGSAAALSPPNSACALNAKAQLLQLLSKDPARAEILRELASQNRPDRDYRVCMDTLKAMACIGPEQWTGIPYQLPGIGTKDGRINYIILLTELINMTKNSSDSNSAMLYWRHYIALARKARDLPVWQGSNLGPAKPIRWHGPGRAF